MIFYRTGQTWFPRKLDSLEPGKLVLSYAIPNHELLPKACLAASPTPTPQKKRLKEIFSISGGKLEDVLSCLSGLMSVSV